MGTDTIMELVMSLLMRTGKSPIYLIYNTIIGNSDFWHTGNWHGGDGANWDSTVLPSCAVTNESPPCAVPQITNEFPSDDYTGHQHLPPPTTP